MEIVVVLDFYNTSAKFEYNKSSVYNVARLLLFSPVEERIPLVYREIRIKMGSLLIRVKMNTTWRKRQLHCSGPLEETAKTQATCHVHKWHDKDPCLKVIGVKLRPILATLHRKWYRHLQVSKIPLSKT